MRKKSKTGRILKGLSLLGFLGLLAASCLSKDSSEEEPKMISE